MADTSQNANDGSKWVDYGNYWLYNEEQRTPGWLKVRKYRLSGSTLGTAVGHSNFSTPDELAQEMAGNKEKVFTEKQLKAMAIGTEQEPRVRDAYCAKTGYTVAEIGFCVPKMDPRIGVSVDGVVIGNSEVTSDVNWYENDELGIIEIKTIQRMYYPLINFCRKGQKPDKEYSHIWRSHYAQMQLGMWVFGKKWCDYVVMCVTDGQLFIQRVPFNQDYWNNILKPGIDDFLDNKLYPLLEKPIKLIMP